jgi:uncharacterized protein YceK
VSVGRVVTGAKLSALLVASALVAGCQTARSFEQGCPGIYSGVRYYGDQVGNLPADGKLFFTLDLPLSAVLDTLVLPGTAFVKPTKPSLGWPEGCRWIER